jgi:predicted 2-oxoglutarate/Fe(II)-dependent dioxygenase YbiX/peroxiredoxin
MHPAPLTVGEPAPWFACPTQGSRRFVFDTVGGRYVVLSFLEGSEHPLAIALRHAIERHRSRFDDINVCFFGVSVHADDERLQRLPDSVPGVRFFFDLDRSVSTSYRAASESDYHPVTYVLDPMLRVYAVLTLEAGVDAHIASLLRVLADLPKIGPSHAAQTAAPILVVPRIFEARLCRMLIDYYQARGGDDSGFMRDVEGKTVKIVDYGHKRRRDASVEDEALRRSCMVRIHDRLLPEVHKAFQFRATRMERYIVSCYDAEEGGHFRPHRDNTTKGTAHRRFAVSLFLNSGEYEGGFLRFPEFGSPLYSAPTGGAVVFSCSLLHEATPVTKGRRYMFLPFLYDEPARRVRDENFQYLDPEFRPADNETSSRAPRPPATGR